MCATKLKFDLANCACIRLAWMEHTVWTQMKYLLMCLPGCLHDSNRTSVLCGAWSVGKQNNIQHDFRNIHMDISSSLLVLHSDVLRGIFSGQRLVPCGLLASFSEILHFIWILLNKQTCWIGPIGNKPLGTSRSFLSVDISFTSFHFNFIICFVMKIHFAHLRCKNAVQSLFMRRFCVPCFSCVNSISVTYSVHDTCTMTFVFYVSVCRLILFM